MKRWPKLLFLDFFTLIAVIVLLAVYVFGVDIPSRRVAISWVLVGGQLVVNAGYLLYQKYKGAEDEPNEHLTSSE